MAAIKLSIDGKHNYSDGRSPIIYRLTHKTKTTRIESGVYFFITLLSQIYLNKTRWEKYTL